MNELKIKLKVLYLHNKKYIDAVFTMIILAFIYALQRGSLEYMVSILKLASELLQVLLNV